MATPMDHTKLVATFKTSGSSRRRQRRRVFPGNTSSFTHAADMFGGVCSQEPMQGCYESAAAPFKNCGDVEQRRECVEIWRRQRRSIVQGLHDAIIG